mgnify:CR=1 FL=1
MVVNLKYILLACAISLLNGCVDSSSPYQATVDDYVAAYPAIELGMNQKEVATILAPSQKRLSSFEIKQPNKYLKNRVKIDIVYYRSGWNSDGITTDDEFTPYVFNNDKLVAIGWQSIGGVKTQGQARNIVNSTATSSVVVY